MNKRTFLTTALAAAGAGTLSKVISPAAQAADSSTDKSQYYELRVYGTQTDRQQQLINDYWKNAAIPAYNRAGVKPIGVFTEVDNPQSNKVYVLIPYDSLEAFAATP